MLKNPFKVGDMVYLMNDVNKEIYRVYAIYSPTMLSLCLLDYETEQDYQVNVKEIAKCPKEKNVK